jgi:hypothetical protein
VQQSALQFEWQLTLAESCGAAVQAWVAGAKGDSVNAENSITSASVHKLRALVIVESVLMLRIRRMLPPWEQFSNHPIPGPAKKGIASQE